MNNFQLSTFKLIQLRNAKRTDKFSLCVAGFCGILRDFAGAREQHDRSLHAGHVNWLGNPVSNSTSPSSLLSPRCVSVWVCECVSVWVCECASVFCASFLWVFLRSRLSSDFSFDGPFATAHLHHPADKCCHSARSGRFSNSFPNRFCFLFLLFFLHFDVNVGNNNNFDLTFFASQFSWFD